MISYRQRCHYRIGKVQNIVALQVARKILCYHIRDICPRTLHVSTCEFQINFNIESFTNQIISDGKCLLKRDLFSFSIGIANSVKFSLIVILINSQK